MNTVCQNVIVASLTSIGTLGIIWVGIYEIYTGRLTIGSLISFITMIGYIFTPVQNLMNVQPLMQQTKVAVERAGDIVLNEYDDGVKSEITDRIESLENTRLSKISMDKVGFSYNGKSDLQLINFKTDGCKKIAILGDSGSGKTTIARLITSLYDDYTGEIILNNNINIKTVDKKMLRKRIGYVSSDIAFFSGSITENLFLGMEDMLQADELDKMMEICELKDFLSSLPHGYNSSLSANATNVSNGQRQLLKNISENFKDIITITITHNCNLAKDCDLILIVDSGTIVEAGSPNELMTKRGKYYQLYQKQ